MDSNKSQPVGIAIDDIPDGHTGEAIFSVNGSDFLVRVLSTEFISEGDIITVIGSGNKVTKLAGVDYSVLNIGGDGGKESVLSEPLDVSDSTVTTEDVSSPEFPNRQGDGHDLDNDDDLVIGPQSVNRSSSVVIAANSKDDGAWSASVSWEDSNGNVYQAESKADIQLDSVAQGWARLVRKAPQVVVTFTNESGGTNRINAHVDTEV